MSDEEENNYEGLEENEVPKEEIEANDGSAKSGGLKSKGKEKIQSVRDYLDSHNLPQILQEGLLKIEKERPTNPVKALGEYLISKSKGK